MPKSLTNHTEKLNQWSANIKMIKRGVVVMVPASIPNTLQYISVRDIAPTSVNVFANNSNFHTRIST